MNDAPFAAAWLTASAWWLDVALGGLLIRMTGELTGGRWVDHADKALRDCAALILPAAVAFAPLLALVDRFPAAIAGTKIPAVWAEPAFVAVRTIAVFLLWFLLARAMGAWRDSRPQRRPRVATAGIILFVPAVALFNVDWSMLPEAPWYSSAAGVVAIAGQAAAGLAFAALLLSLRQPAGHELAERQDVGNLLLVAVLLWAYVAFMEYLIVWIADLPHETVWYRRRTGTAASLAAGAFLVLKFALPSVLLMSRQVKRSRVLLAVAAGSVLVGHGAEVWWRHRGSVAGAAWMDALAIVAVTSACLAFAGWRSGRGSTRAGAA